MLHQKRSGNLARLKYLLAIPISAGLLCASTLAFSKTYGWVDIGPHRIDKNNKTAQVKEPGSRLLITQHGTSFITDKFTAKRPNGSTRVYTAYNISNKDVVDLENQGIIVNVISNVKIDSANHPKIADAQITRVKFPLPNPMTTHTGKGYYYSEAFYTANGKTDVVVTFKEKNGKLTEYDKDKLTVAEVTRLKDIYGYLFPAHVQIPPRTQYYSKTTKNVQVEEYQYLYNNKIDFSVAIYKHNRVVASYFKSQVSPAIIKLLSDMYGYTFPANGNYQLAHPVNPSALPASAVRLVLPRVIPADPAVVSAPSPTAKMIRFPPPMVKTDIAPPPPPRPPVAAKSHKIPPLAVPDVPRAASAPAVTAKSQMKPPPPPPFEYAYKDFFDYLSKATLYPTKAYENNVMGVAVAQYTLDADHHITNILVRKGNTEVFNESILRALKSYNGSINKAPGMYAVVFRFAIAGKTNTDEVREEDGKLIQTPNYTGEITIVGYKK